MDTRPEVITAKAVPLNEQGLVPPESFPGFKNRFGRVLIRLRAKTLTFLALSLLAVLLPTAVLTLGVMSQSTLSLDPAGAAENWPTFALIVSLLWAASLMAFLSIQAAIGAAAAFKVKLLKSLGVGMTRSVWHLLTLITANLYLLPVTVLLIPGIVSSPRLLLTLPVLLTEKRKLYQGMARSRDLVYGHTARLVLELAALNIIIPIVIGISAVMTNASAGLLRDVLAASNVSWAEHVTILIPAAVALLLSLISLPLNMIYLQIFYEDSIREKGWDWTPTTWRLRTYQVVSFLGLALIVALPLTAGALIFNMLTGAQSEADLPTANEIKEVIVTAPATVSGAAPETPIEESPAATSDDMAVYEGLTKIRIGLSDYFSANQSYPEKLDYLAPKFLTKVPKVPPSDEPFDFEVIGRDYRITFTLEKGIFALSPGKHTMTSSGFDVPIKDTSNYQPTSPVVQYTPPPETPIETTEPATTAGLFEEPTEYETTPATTADAESEPPAEMPSTVAGQPEMTEEEPALPEVMTDPTLDSDSDGLTDAEESIYGTDPNNPDTDNDGYLDGAEVSSGYNPNGAGKL